MPTALQHIHEAPPRTRHRSRVAHDDTARLRRHNRRIRRARRLLGRDACRQLGLVLIPPDLRISVVIPVYNERRWLGRLLKRVKRVPIPKEIIVVDDGSTDGTRAILANLEDPKIRVVLQPRNRGKGAAVREGFRRATGDIVIVQDADLEYDPADYPRLIAPIVEGDADVVYGTRFHGGPRRVYGFCHYLANRFLTGLSNLLTGWNLSDMETGYKVFRREALEGVELRSNRFGFEPEITARLARRRPAWRVYEVPIQYRGRTRAEGKKIGVRDAIAAVWTMVRCLVTR